MRVRFLRAVVLDGVDEIIVPADPAEEDGLNVASSLDMEVQYEFRAGQVVEGELVDQGDRYDLRIGNLVMYDIPKGAVVVERQS